VKYRANPVEVDAFVITSVGTTDDDGTRIVLDNGEPVIVTPAMTARELPEVGGYLVTQADGYTYLNPKHVFERKYSPVATGKVAKP
jgi:hypothetical protein